MKSIMMYIWTYIQEGRASKMYTEKWSFVGQDGKVHLTQIRHSCDRNQMDDFYSREQKMFDDNATNVKFPGRSHIRITRAI